MRLAGIAHKFAARAQPDPGSARMAHAEHAIDAGIAGIGKLRGELVKLDVVRMNQPADFAEAQELVVRRQPENVEHRLRPEHAPAGEVPVPESAPAAVERGVDAAAHGVLDAGGFAHQPRLPQECETEHEHHKAGSREQCDGESRVGAPLAEHDTAALGDRELAQRTVEIAAREQDGRSVG